MEKIGAMNDQKEQFIVLVLVDLVIINVSVVTVISFAIALLCNLFSYRCINPPTAFIYIYPIRALFMRLY